MKLYVPATFAFLFVAFYQLSGGSDYAPRDGSLQAEAQKQRETRVAEARTVATPVASTKNRAEAGEAVVTRASLDLNTIATSAPAKAEVAELPKVQPIARVRLLTNAVAAPVTVRARPQMAPKAKDVPTILKSRVNMRMGPGTFFNVLTKVDQGMEVEVLQEPGNGWMKLRIVETGKLGWMSASLVSAAAN